MEYRLLGPFEVHRDGRSLELGGHRQRALLAILVISAGRVVAADALIDRLWGEDPPTGAAATLHAYISGLRRVLEPDRAPRAPASILATLRPGYVLQVDPDQIDAQRFLALAAEGQHHLASADPEAAAGVLRAALGLWRGPALLEFASQPFATAEIARLDEARLQAIEDRVEADLALGRHQALAGELTNLVSEHPLRERLRGHLMLALYRAGRQAEALDAARVGRERLADELGIDPDPAVRQLEERILRQDPALDWQHQAQTRVGLPGAPAPRPGLVGRDTEVAVLERAWRSAAAKAGRMVLVGGEPGIGKTRLAEAFGAGVPADNVLWGRCDEGAGVPPFWPWRQILRSAAASRDNDALIGLLGTDAALVGQVVPEIGARLPQDVPSSQEAEDPRFRFFDAASRILGGADVDRPVAVILDDLHWADAASLEMLRFLAARLQGSTLTVVATYRDNAVDDNPQLAETLAGLAREPMVERLMLPGLEPADVGLMLGSLLGERPAEDLVRAVHDRTDGNPLFVTHLARLLAVGGTHVTGEPHTAVLHDVPHEVVDLIAWRVDALPEATQTLLATAAAVGRHFDLGVLVQIHEEGPDEVIARIEPAVRAGLAVEQQMPGVFRFTHGLIREAILARLGTTRVARLHGSIADALAARRVDDRDLATIADHYWAAAGVGWTEHALAAAVAAAEHALATFAYEDAERHLGHSVELLAALPATPERDSVELSVRLHLGRLALVTCGYTDPSVAQAFGRARLLAQRLGRVQEHIGAVWGLAAYHMMRAEHDTVLRFSQELQEEAGRSAEPLLRFAAHQCAAGPLVHLGRLTEAVTHLEASLRLSEPFGSDVLALFPQDPVSATSLYLAMACWLQGAEQRAETLAAEGVRRALELGGYDAVLCLVHAAQLAVLQRQLDAVLERTDAALQRVGERGFPLMAAQARILRGWALTFRAPSEQGLTLIAEGLSALEGVGSRAWASMNRTLLAEALLNAGLIDEARQAVEQALDTATATREAYYEPETWRLHAAVLLASTPAEVDAAACSLERAVARATELGSRPFRRRAEELLGRLRPAGRLVRSAT